jgi:hypothetical protein
MKMFKTKQWSLIAMMAVVLMGLAACSDDDEVGSRDDLIGTWQEDYESYWEKENGKITDQDEDTFDDDRYAWRYTFYEDGRYNNQEGWNGSWDNYWGTWTMKSNTIILDEGTSRESSATIKTLNKNTLVVEFYEKEVESGTTYEYYSLQRYHRVTDEND